MDANLKSYGVTVSGGTVLHTVAGNMADVDFRSGVTSLCGRKVRPANVFANLADYQRSYNAHGRDCPQCVRAAVSGMVMS